MPTMGISCTKQPCILDGYEWKVNKVIDGLVNWCVDAWAVGTQLANDLPDGID